VKDRLSSDNEVYEIKKTVLKSPIIFAGFVGAGLVGTLAVGCMIDKLKMKEIAYLRSKTSASINCFHARTTKTSVSFILKR